MLGNFLVNLKSGFRFPKKFETNNCNIHIAQYFKK